MLFRSVLIAAAFPQILAATEKVERVPRAGAFISSERIEFVVTGMTCAGCAVAVKSALEKLPEVAETTVNYKTGRAIVWLNSGISDEAAARARAKAMIERQGFKVEAANPIPADELR